MLSDDEFARVLDRCRALPAPKGNYLVNDYVSNLLLTVLDFQQHTTTVERAHQFYKRIRWNEVRTLVDLKALLAKYRDDEESNRLLAKYLWDYELWTRIELLRKLVTFFEQIGVTTQDALRQWAATSSFDNDFKGKVKGLGYAIYNWLVMRQGIETVKPDVHVHSFVRSTVGRSLDDRAVVALLVHVARELGIKAYELDWRIWESQRDRGGNTTETNSQAPTDTGNSIGTVADAPAARPGTTLATPRESRAGADWMGFIRRLQEQLDVTERITLSVDEIIARTGTRDQSVCSRGFWRANQRGARDFDAFTKSDIAIEFFPDERGATVTRVTFLNAGDPK